MTTTKQKKNGKIEAAAALTTLRGFIGKNQLAVVADACRGEEKQFFFDKLVELADRVKNMPHTYQQDGKGDKAIVYLHYFAGGAANWWITEKDKGTPEEATLARRLNQPIPQQQAFGLANLFGGPTDQDAELGYISIEEILANNGELDFYFSPRTLGELKHPLKKAA